MLTQVMSLQAYRICKLLLYAVDCRLSMMYVRSVSMMTSHHASYMYECDVHGKYGRSQTVVVVVFL